MGISKVLFCRKHVIAHIHYFTVIVFYISIFIFIISNRYMFFAMLFTFVVYSNCTSASTRHAKENEINPLNTELNSICHLLALLGVHHILHVSRIRVNGVVHILTLLSFHISCSWRHIRWLLQRVPINWCASM
jgi:hypothetical protein